MSHKPTNLSVGAQQLRIRQLVEADIVSTIVGIITWAIICVIYKNVGVVPTRGGI